METNLFYKPEGAWAADFIPLYAEGRYCLFYLLDWRNVTEHGEGTPWYQISTNNFIDFTEHGLMLPRGAPNEQDLYVFTGSAIKGPSQYHIFYTGHNPHYRAEGKPEQGVMHAVSDDLISWRKIPEDTFYAPRDQYEMHDWRDPFVFWNEGAGEYWMLLAARLKSGPSRRRGCTALCVSTDLTHWEVRDPFYSPGLYYTHECPDLFKMGDWWYLVFSEFSERCVTRYRIARSLSGPWLAPDDDQFDGRAFYAAKTASDGNKRYIFGWNPTREGGKDYGAWHWGGNLVVHELTQQPDGLLSVQMPESVRSHFRQKQPLMLHAGTGQMSASGSDQVNVDGGAGYGCVLAGEMPECCLITTAVTLDAGCRGAGVMLRCSDDCESAYYIRLEPSRNRLVFDMYPRAGDVPHMVELERPLPLKSGQTVAIEVLIDGSMCEVYVNHRIALSTRLYNLTSGQWGVFVNEGSASFSKLACLVHG